MHKTMKKITKDQFVALLNEAGVSDSQKQRLHALFEQRHPDAHQGFLEFLGVPAQAIQEIRERSRKACNAAPPLPAMSQSNPRIANCWRKTC